MLLASTLIRFGDLLFLVESRKFLMEVLKSLLDLFEKLSMRLLLLSK